MADQSQPTTTTSGTILVDRRASLGIANFGVYINLVLSIATIVGGAWGIVVYFGEIQTNIRTLQHDVKNVQQQVQRLEDRIFPLNNYGYNAGEKHP